jgi:flagellar motor switch protein FliM
MQLGAVVATRPDFPGLTRVANKMARGLTRAFAASGGSTKVTAGEIATLTFAEWKAGLLPAVAVARYRERAIKGGLLLSVPSRLIASLVDIFYGGDGAIDPERFSIGAAEQRLFDRFAGQAGEVLTAAWADVERLTPALAASSFAIEDVSFGKPEDVVVIQQFATDDPQAGKGMIELVYPLVALRSIAGLQGATEVTADEADPVWRTRLSDAVMQARLPVRTVIARPTVALSRLMSLAPGDFIPVTLPPRVPLTVAGRLLAHGTIGEANGRAAIKIDKLEQGAFYDD